MANIYDYQITSSLLTTDEIIGYLNLDSDFEPLSKLEMLSKEATQMLYLRTGHDWALDTPMNETAKGAARDYIYQVWYGGDDHVLRRLEHSIIQLQAMVDKDGNLYTDEPSSEEDESCFDYGSITVN